MPSVYNAVTVTTVATVIVDANNGRKGAIVFNAGPQVIYLGMDSSVTTANGIPVVPFSSMDQIGEFAGWRGAIWGITGSATSDVRYWDWIG